MASHSASPRKAAQEPPLLDVCVNCGHGGHGQRQCPCSPDPAYRLKVQLYIARQTVRRRQWREHVEEHVALPSDFFPGPVLPPLRYPPDAADDDRAPFQKRPSRQATQRGLLPADNPDLVYLCNKRVDVLDKIAKPACEDRQFAQYRVGEDMTDIVKQLGQDYVVLIRGGETWEAQGFGLETLIQKGVIRREMAQEEVDFIDMKKSVRAFKEGDRKRKSPKKKGRAARMTVAPTEDEPPEPPEPPGTFHRQTSLQEFFTLAENIKIRLNLLDLPYTLLDWPSCLKHVQHATVPQYVFEHRPRTETIARPVSEEVEQSWAIVSHAWTWTNPHHDAGGRSTMVHILVGEKYWYYFRPNDAGRAMWREQPNAFIVHLQAFEEAALAKIGQWYYVRLLPGYLMLQPPLHMHCVWTSEDSIMAGKLFDLLTFRRVEECMQEEHAVGELSTNAVRFGWWDALHEAAVALSHPSLTRAVLTDADLLALDRLICNPLAYIPKNGMDADLAELEMWLVVEEVAAVAAGTDPAKARADSLATCQQEREDIYKHHEVPLDEEERAQGLAESHDARVHMHRKALAALREKKRERLLTQEVVREKW